MKVNESFDSNNASFCPSEPIYALWSILKALCQNIEQKKAEIR